MARPVHSLAAAMRGPSAPSLFALLLFVTCAPTLAHAQDQDPTLDPLPSPAPASAPASDRPTASPSSPPRTLLLEGDLGMGAPLGWAGAALVLAPLRELAFDGGVGIGSQGVQLSAGIRGRKTLSDKDQVGLGLGWSMGSYAGVPSSAPPIPVMGPIARPNIFYWRRAHFVNIEGSLEHDTGSVVLRPFLGFGYVVNGDDALFVNGPCNAYTSCSKTIARIVPYFGVAIALGVL